MPEPGTIRFRRLPMQSIAFLVIVYMECIIKIKAVNTFNGRAHRKRAKFLMGMRKPPEHRRRALASPGHHSRRGEARRRLHRDRQPDAGGARRSSATRRAERVLAAIKATGYTPNMAARNLRARRSMMVLVVVPNIANAFFAEVLRGIDDELVEHGYGIIIGNLDNRPEREARYVDLVFAGQVDAVLLMSGRVPVRRRTADERSRRADGDDLRRYRRLLPSIMVDDHKSSRTVVEHLVSLGHRSFGYVSGPAGNRNEIGRHEGFVAGLAAAGFDPGRGDLLAGRLHDRLRRSGGARIPGAPRAADRGLCRQQFHGDLVHEDRHGGRRRACRTISRSSASTASSSPNS